MSAPVWTFGEIGDCVLKPFRKFADTRGWLAELFREDELSASLLPVMAYVSLTRAGVARGPHEHRHQTDLFAFFNGSFRLYLWDNRPATKTFGHRQNIDTGEANPVIAIIPPGVIHAYRNTGTTDAVVLNCPNRLYAGHNRQDPVDEIRYENTDNFQLILD